MQALVGQSRAVLGVFGLVGVPERTRKEPVRGEPPEHCARQAERVDGARRAAPVEAHVALLP